MSCIDALALGDDASLAADPSFTDSQSHLSTRGSSLDSSNGLEVGSVDVEDREPWGNESGRDESAGLGASMIGTELGLTLSAKEPRLVGELLLLDKEGKGGCNTTQTCCCTLPWSDVILLFTLPPCFTGTEERSISDLSGFSSLSAKKKINFKNWLMY